MTDQLTDEKPAPAPDTHPETRQGLLLPIVMPLGIFLGIGLLLFGFSRVLLSVSAAAATVIALVVAASILGVATIVASRERLSNGTLFSMIGVVAGVAMLAGGIAIVTIGTGKEAGGGGGGPQVVALMAPKGAAVTGFQPTDTLRRGGQADRARLHQPGSRYPAQRRDLPRGPGQEPQRDPGLHRRSGHGGEQGQVRRAGTSGRHALLPLRGAPDDHGGDDRVRRRWGRRGTRRPGRHRERAIVRYQGARPSGRAADDDHVPQRGRRHPAQHRHLHRPDRCPRLCSRASSSRVWQRRSIRSRRSTRGRITSIATSTRR